MAKFRNPKNGNITEIPDNYEQGTGVYDIHGNEIFIGDIVRAHTRSVKQPLRKLVRRRGLLGMIDRLRLRKVKHADEQEPRRKSGGRLVVHRDKYGAVVVSHICYWRQNKECRGVWLRQEIQGLEILGHVSNEHKHA